MALGPRGSVVHHPPRGPSAMPVGVRSAQTLGLMSHTSRTRLPQVATLVAGALTLVACAPTASIKAEAHSPLLGTWAEIITAAPANPIDGRQVIERFSNGTFKLVYVRTHPAQPPCTGTWATTGSTYRAAFTSVACFSAATAKPAVGAQYQFEILESSASRLTFNVPSGVALASWQAKLEGGIE